MRNKDILTEENVRLSLEALVTDETPRRSLFLPVLACALSVLLALFSYFLYRPNGYGEIFYSASLIGEFLTDNGAVSVFLGLDEEKEEAERRARIEEKAKAYVEECQG